MTGHPGPELSALVDGALDPSERAEVEAHLAGCETCRRELRAVTELRAAVASLPPVDPPVWFLASVLADGPQPHTRRVRRVRLGVANVAATAAAWLVLVGATGQAATPAASPDLAGMVAAHRQAAAAPLTAGYGMPMEAPDTLGRGYELVGYRRAGGSTQAVYRNGDRWVSLFAEPGRLAAEALPAGAERLEVEGERAWAVESPSGGLVLVDRGDSVLVLVGEPGATPTSLPEQVLVAAPGEAVLDRLVEAGAGLLRAFSLAG